jgi:hypothetical protein
MSLVVDIKTPIKRLRWQQRRFAVARRFGKVALAQMPIVIGNAMPKSGSHLLSQILLGLTRIGPFVDPGMPPLTRSEANSNLAEPAILRRIAALGPGDIAYAYLHARQPYLSELTRQEVAAFFVYRDPRDMLVSHVYYATELYPGHGMHAYYNRLPSMEERLNAAIEGVSEKGSELSPIREKYDHYLGWLDQPELLSLRFEDLVLKREAALAQILDHLAKAGFSPQKSREEAIASLSSAIAPRKSGTFRRGQPGEWREHFTAENIARFKLAAGDLLQRLGYETGSKW